MSITFLEGRDLAKHFGCKFIETSAKVGVNVDETFTDLVREIRRYNKVRYLLKIYSPSDEPFRSSKRVDQRLQAAEALLDCIAMGKETTRMGLMGVVLAVLFSNLLYFVD